jgi:hypothetical protein
MHCSSQCYVGGNSCKCKYYVLISSFIIYRLIAISLKKVYRVSVTIHWHLHRKMLVLFKIEDLVGHNGVKHWGKDCVRKWRNKCRIIRIFLCALNNTQLLALFELKLFSLSTEFFRRAISLQLSENTFFFLFRKKKMMSYFWFVFIFISLFICFGGCVTINPGAR